MPSLLPHPFLSKEEVKRTKKQDLNASLKKEETKHNKEKANEEPAWKEIFQEKKNVSDKYYSTYSKKLKKKYSLKSKLKEDISDIAITEERMTGWEK